MDGDREVSPLTSMTVSAHSARVEPGEVRQLVRAEQGDSPLRGGGHRVRRTDVAGLTREEQQTLEMLLRRSSPDDERFRAL